MTNGFNIPNACIGLEVLGVDDLAIYTLTPTQGAQSARIFFNPTGTTGTPQFACKWDPDTGTPPDATTGAQITDTGSYLVLPSITDIRNFQITGLIAAMATQRIQVFYYNNSSNVS